MAKTEWYPVEHTLKISTNQINPIVKQQKTMADFAVDPYPTFFVTINNSISLSKSSNIIPYIISPMRSIMHILFQFLNLLVVIFQRWAYCFLLIIAQTSNVISRNSSAILVFQTLSNRNRIMILMLYLQYQIHSQTCMEILLNTITLFLLSIRNSVIQSLQLFIHRDIL